MLEDKSKTGPPDQIQPSTPAAPSESNQGETATPIPRMTDKADTFPLPESASRWQKYRHWYGSHKKITIPASIALVIMLILAIPVTRYPTVGLVLKKDFTLRVVDSSANTPVSGATVSLGSISSQTDGTGQAVLRGIPVGKKTVSINKKYYEGVKSEFTVPILFRKNTPEIKLVATGRQVNVTVTDKITGKSIAGVDIKLADISAKTGSDGKAAVVLAADAKQEDATLSAKGYNSKSVEVLASASEITQNDYNLTPSGKIYFLSKLTGRLDVVKTNLDGSERQTVLAGTGNEDSSDSVLLASRDWKYLALRANRGAGSLLYLIDTATDKLSIIDQGNASFTPIGWEGHNFIYLVDKEGVPLWQSGNQALKSYSAATGKNLFLNQTRADGSSSDDYAAEYIQDYYIIDGKLVFAKSWEFGSDSQKLKPAELSAGFYSVAPDGQGLKTLKTFGYKVYETAEEGGVLSTNYYSFGGYLSKPKLAYFNLYNSDQDSERYFKYTDSQLIEDSGLSKTFSRGYETAYTYLLSPSGQQTFWAEPRDGKNTLFIGSADGGDAKQIGELSEHTAYGWFSDNYLLTSKDSSELYIMGTETGSPAIKITDYHKPDYSFYGYGGGYGGL
ncbi:MAG: carboxypeptidase-like regulatory domain-containing protein [Candidatus Saccharimonadales bacterium]